MGAARPSVVGTTATSVVIKIVDKSMMATRVSSLLGHLKQPSFGIYALSPGQVNEGRDYYFCTHVQTSAPPIFYNYTYCSCTYTIKKEQKR